MSNFKKGDTLQSIYCPGPHIEILDYFHDLRQYRIRYLESNIISSYDAQMLENFCILYKRTELKCVCGAAKAGYTKPCRSHSDWCEMYRE